ncbi:peptidylprolyl isomerase [Vallitalea okinawensis]|uniref:peptidylprolyl isomerase n=1 Tax=Vallitalea okinawensis TaxID=2078660 RepID=UPI000CFC8B07|nr:peptidylprolyl isomerase [Vallitalea okinawensis]
MENKVLAKVGNTEITALDMEKVIAAMPGGRGQEQFNNPTARKQLLDEMVNREMIYLNAVDEKLEENPEFKKLMDEAKHNLLQQFAIDTLIKDIKVEENESQEYYEKNQEMFKSPEEVRASHILIADEEEARKVADDVKAGKDFAEAAKEHSICPSKERGGDLGFFSRGKMVPAFEEAAFALEVGEISHLVKSDFGYHIIKVENKKVPQTKSFEEVKGQIDDYLLRQKRTIRYADKVKVLKEQYDVELNEDAFKA